MREIKEGFIPFKGYKTYYRIVGKCDEGKSPLLALHGGPGAAHDYLESLDPIADTGRAVVYYDQIGCGKSPTPSMPDFWCTELWEEELDVVREALGLKSVHILGQSWGGMLAMQYATHHPKGVKSMIVASSPSSTALWLKEANRLRTYLPQDMQEALIQADNDGDYSRPEVVAASDEYYRRHVIKLDPQPDFVIRSMSQMGEPYMVMQGASEFVMTGKLKDWDITDELKNIDIPTLVTSGSADEATPYISKVIYDRIPDCQWELFDGGTHLCHVEMAEEYNAVVEAFMAAHD
ncbi:MAG: alpha/beta fold hydrolase [Ruminococcaceae bacterium]|nr:alpha/beta fold hydrolase [Oscillospiraceae bacterium]